MTPETLWIIVAVVAAVVLIAVGLGLVLRRRRRISLRQAEELTGDAPDTAPPRRGGTYQAGGGFSFSSGADTAAPPRTLAPPAEPPPAQTPPADTPAPPVPRPLHGDTTLPDTPRSAAPVTADPAPPGTAIPTAPPAPSDAQARPDTAGRLDTAGRSGTAERPDAAQQPVDQQGTVDDQPRTGTPPAAAERVEVGEPTGTTSAPHDSRTEVTTPPDLPRATPPRPADPPVRDAAPASTNGAATAPTPPAPTPAPTPIEEIAPPGGRLERLRGRLARSRSGFGQGLLGLLGAGELDEDSWEDVEAMLLQADLGPEMTAELVEALRTQLAARAVRTPEQAKQLLRDVLTDALRSDLDRSVRALPHDGRPAVLLVVGVNGTGKTTTTGKLARVLVAGGHRVVLGAADTFRAAAAEQLMTWGERAGATVVRGAEGADPASVAFDAVKRGAEEGADAVLLDTAGRLHTKTGLMDELQKVKRVVERQAEVDEVLLVLDATTGQNGLTQARVFGDVVKVTGIVLTKLDGTAKGGIVFRVQRELGVPVKLVGLGEGPDDLAPFEPAAYVDALLN